MKHFSAAAAILFLLVAGAFQLAFAQSNGATSSSIIGVVKDEQGRVIAGATIEVREINTNLARTTQSRDDGSYTIVQLPPGDYILQVSSEGFQHAPLRTTLNLGTTGLLDVTMLVSNGSDLLSVFAVDSGLEPNKTEKSTVITKEMITNLPIDRRDFLTFAINTAGTATDPLPLGGAQANSNINFNGQNARQNNVTIDGIDNNDLYSGSVRSTYSQEAVKEFQVISNSYAAEFGRAQAGVVNIITRTGTNELHGTLFVINRNDKLSARNAFAVDKSPLSQYQFGATLGGPIKKDRAFFFGAFERLTLKRSVNVSVAPNIIASLNRVGFPARGGAIPFSEASSTFLGRADLNLTTNNQLAIRYNFARSYDGKLEDFGASRIESAGGVKRLRDDSISFANTYLSTRLNLVNETRFLYARRDFEVDPIDPFGPRVSLGVATAGRNIALPSPRLEHIYQIVDNVSLQRGRNQFKFGIDYLHTDLPKDSTAVPTASAGQAFFQPFNFGAQFPTFTALEAFDPAIRTPAQQAFLAFLGAALPSRVPGFPNLDLTKLSLPAIFVQGFGNPKVGLSYNYISAFAQDDLRVSSKLFVKLGLRYDQERVELLPKNRGNFSPRIGIAYRPIEKINLHAAYGIFHGVTPFAPVLNIAVGDQNNFRVPLLPFPLSIIPFALPGHHYPESQTLPAGVAFRRQLSVEQDVQPDFRNGYTQQVNAGIDYQLEQSTVVSASYQFVRGNKLFMSRNINPVVRNVGNAIDDLAGGRLDPTRGQIQELESAGDSYYHALTLEVNRRFGRHYTFLANYTFSKTIDDFIDYRTEFVSFQNPLNIGSERGLSLQDQRHRFVFSGIWALDYTENKFLRGFQLSTIVRLESGQPYNLLAGVDLDGNGDLAAPADRPNRIGRNVGILPGFAKVDLRLTRRVTIKERYAIEGFVEAFNLFNRVNISSSLFTYFPNADGSFNLPKQENGRYIVPKERQVGAFAPRQFQLGIRISF